MTSSPDDRWQRIDAVFSDALDRPEPERAAFVRRACAGDAALEAEVLDLLRSGEAASAWWDRAGTVRARLLADVASPESATEDLQGTLLGAWRLGPRIARGGMGSVYLAHRADGRFEQRVAVKLLRRGLDTEDVINRFLSERRILAALEHTGIARLLDGGEAPDGRPYLVLEYVEGKPITTYCDEARLDIARRLRLIEEVGRVVQHAHRHLVVHRDLKPSNVLVTPEGEVKLLDFGIAKLLDPAEPDTPSPFTRTGIRLMTPGYASPEQVRGEPVTTVSDVYQLGLLLYELLAGQPPLKLANVSRAELEHRVLELEPERPSHVTDDKAAQVRGVDLVRLRRLLRGDLDQVCLMALRKEPDRRYPTAERLVEDLERYRLGLPVRARTGTAQYRIGKFVRRNRLRVVVAAAGILLLAGYGVTITQQGRRIAAQRDRAELEAAKANQVADFMVGLFESANPDRAEGRQLPVIEVLDLGARRVEVELAQHPALQAALLAAIGRSYSALGRAQDARPLLEQALEAGRMAFGDVHPTLARDVAALAAVVRATDWRQSLELYQDALEMAEQAVGRQHRVYARILADYGEALSLDATREAESHHLRDTAVAILRRLVPPAPEDLAHALSVSAYGTSAEISIPLMREALEVRRALFGDRHSSVAASLSDLALAMEPLDPHEADSLMSQAVEINVAVMGAKHPATLMTLNSLAALRRDQGAYAEAAPIYAEVIAIRRAVYPEQRLRLAYPLYGQGLVLTELGSHQAGEELLREALGILEETRAGSPLITLTRAAIGHNLAGQRRFPEAESLLVPAAEALQETPVPALDKARALERVARLYEAWNRPQQAGTYRKRLRDLAARERLVQYPP